MTLDDFHSRPQKHPLIHGRTDSGEELSLLNCFQVHARYLISDDHAELELVVNAIVFGFQASESEILLSQATAHFDCAREWAAKSGLSIDTGQLTRGRYSVAFNPPSNIVLFDDGEMSVTLYWGLDGAPLTADIGTIRLKEVVSISVSVRNPRPLRAVLEIVYAIQHLLSVACLRLCTLQRLVLFSPGSSADTRLRGTYHALPRYEHQSTREREPDDPLFVLSDVEDPRRLFSLWFEKEKKLRSILGLYLSALYADRFIGAKVLSLAQACEVFHRRFRGGLYFDEAVYANDVLPALKAALPTALPPDTRNALTGKLTFMNELSLRTRVKRLAAENNAAWKVLNVKPAKLVALALTYRDQLVHYSADDADIVETRVLELVDCVSLLAAMVELSILREIGFSEDAITTLAQRSHTYYDRFTHFSD
jgi:hypothetical protein